MEKKRSAGAVILAIIAVFAGIVAVIDTLRYLHILPIASFGEARFFGFSIFGALLSGVVAVIWFGVARQLWNEDPRGLSFVMIISVLFLIFDVIYVIGGTPLWVIMPSILVNGIALVIAILPSTKEAFGVS